MRAENAVLSEEEWMDGNNILLVVSASWKNYWFTANIHSLVLLSLWLFLLSSPPYHISIFAFRSPLSLLSVSVPLLFHTAPPMCTLTPNSGSGRGLAPDFSVLDLGHVTLTCYVLQGCSAARGPHEEKGCVHQRQETKHRSEGT